MIQQSPGSQGGVGKLVENWHDLYRRQLYQLAQFEIETAAAQDPTDAGLQFLVGVTELARHRGEAAITAFDTAAGLLAKGGPGRSLRSDMTQSLPEVIRKVNALGRKRAALAAPPEPFAWLQDPATIGQRIINRVTVQPKPIIEFRSGSLIDDVRIMDAPAPAAEAGIAAPTLARPEAQPLTAQSARSAQALTAVGTSVSGEWSNWERDLVNLLSRSDAAGALAMVDRALTQNPDNVWLVEWRAKVLDRSGRTRDAVNQYVTAISMARKAGMRDVVERLGRDALHQGRDHREGLLALATSLSQANLTELSGAAARQAVDIARRGGNKELLVATMQRAAVLVEDPTQFQHELARLRGEVRNSVASGMRALADDIAQAIPAPTGAAARAKRGNLPPEQRRSMKEELAKQKVTPGQQGLLALLFMLFGGASGCAGFGLLPLLMLVVITASVNKASLGSVERGIVSFATIVLTFATFVGLINSKIPW